MCDIKYIAKEFKVLYMCYPETHSSGTLMISSADMC